MFRFGTRCPVLGVTGSAAPLDKSESPCPSWDVHASGKGSHFSVLVPAEGQIDARTQSLFTQ